ncbi:MAG: DNA repair protein RecO [Candidatus Neptunochlamydia sp.]|nr:DNA repair protein RecO [Candidatus Neptunochlamydia sp.]
MNDEKTEGIVLKAVPFKENDRILSLFTPDQGVISLYVRRLSKKKPALMNLTTPPCRGEYLFRKGRSDLYRFIDGTILDLHLPLRRSYHHLEYAGKMLQAILKSQMPGKSAKNLYHFLASYLKKLSEASFPETLWASFALKLLKYEGLLAVDETCLSCEKNTASHISEGESRCEKCAAPLSLSFSSLDWKTLQVLSHVRSFDPILKVELPSSLIQEIDTLFSLHQI